MNAQNVQNFMGSLFSPYFILKIFKEFITMDTHILTATILPYFMVLVYYISTHPSIRYSLSGLILILMFLPFTP